MSFCVKCKKQLKPDSKYCSACGAKVNAPGFDGSDKKAQAGTGLLRGLFSKVDAAITEFSDNFSRVSDEVEELMAREKPGAFCPKSCLVTGDDCAECVRRQNKLELDLAALSKREQIAGKYYKADEQWEKGSEHQPLNDEAFEAASGTENDFSAEAEDPLARLNEQQREVLTQATAICNDMIDILAQAKDRTEETAKRITEKGGALAMSLSVMGEKPRGYKHYTKMTDEQLFRTSEEFKLGYSDYISRLYSGDTCTWAAFESEGKIGKAVAIGAAVVGALAVSAAAAPSGGGLSQTLKENQERTRASNAQVAQLRSRSMEIDRQAREKNRRADQSLHKTFMKQREDMARTDNTIRNRQILRNDLRRATDKYSTKERFSFDVDKALNEFTEAEKENNE